MKRSFRIFCLFCSVCFMICGCGKKHTQPAAGGNVAVRIDIQGLAGNESLYRSYAQPAKIEAVLIYLRLLQPRGPVQLPTEKIAEYYEITVYLANGDKRIHRQYTDSYATASQGWWGSIDPRYGQELIRLIRYIPSDSLPETSLKPHSNNKNPLP